MAGFFKKLFNRITGRKDEAPLEDAQQQAALPPPEPEPEPVIEQVTAPAEPAVAERVITPATKAEKPHFAKKPEPKVPVKKAAAKPIAPKKPEPKKPEAKKVAEPKKVEAKKPEPVAVPKKAVAKSKPETKILEPKKPELKKPEPKKLEPKPVQKITPPLLPEPVQDREPVPAVIVTPEPLPPPVIETPSSAPPPEPALAPVPIAKPATPSAPPSPEPERKGWFARLKDGLSKSSKSLTGSITAIFTKRKLDAATLQELEDTLIQADLGLAVSERIIKAVSTGRYDKEIDPEEVRQILASEVAKVLKPVEVPFNFGEEKPFVVLVVGVNGSGKTTTIGKLGAIAAGEGFKVKFVACDTFRAAAIEQLTVWGKRIGVETMSRPQGSDASGLAFDAMKAAQEDGTEIMFIDTAGRLHNKTYLMDELDKVVRVIKKYDANAPHAVLLVLDATTGQNALAQAEAFTKVAGVTGLIMTKLDGTARGGILVAIAEAYKLPIHAIGVGEKIEDLQPFDADGFARAIAGLEDA